MTETPPALVVVDVPHADVGELHAVLAATAARVRSTSSATSARLVAAGRDPDTVVTAVRAAMRVPGRTRWRVAVAVVDDAEFAAEWRPWLGSDRAAASGPGRALVVQPPWMPPPGGGGPTATGPDVVVRIDPGGAFGGGAHPSTRHALDLLATVVTPGATVLDVGCGSGVLAIAAALLGAGRVVATDVDPAAVEATAANARGNRAGVVAVTTTPVQQITDRFDLVVANIETLVLDGIAPALADRVRPGGDLVVAGVLAPFATALRARFEDLAGPAVDERTGPDDWVAWRFRRSD